MKNETYKFDNATVRIHGTVNKEKIRDAKLPSFLRQLKAGKERQRKINNQLRKEHEMQSETKAMLVAATALMVIDYKWMAIAFVIIALVCEQMGE